jgi:hypothetical protein
MNPLQIQAELRKLKSTMGPRADVYCGVEANYSKPLSLSAYPSGLCNGTALRVEAHDWPELFILANEKWAERNAEFHARMVTEIALQIIRLTAEFGECTEAALRGDKYSQEDLLRWGTEASAKANEMASNGPFSIIPSAKANAA